MVDQNYHTGRVIIKVTCQAKSLGSSESARQSFALLNPSVVELITIVIQIKATNNT